MRFECSISRNDLVNLLKKQLKNFFIVLQSILIDENIDEALKRIKKCFSASRNKYFVRDETIYFNPYNTVQYSIFLYTMSKVIVENSNLKSDFARGGGIVDQIYYLNKIMNGVDWFYEINLPEHFLAEHPIGSVLGKAKYGDYFFIYQVVTVGGNKGLYPVIGNSVVMYSNAKVLGKSRIGDNVIVSANTYIKDEDIPSNSVVFGQSPNLVIKKKLIEEITSMRSRLLWN